MKKIVLLILVSIALFSCVSNPKETVKKENEALYAEFILDANVKPRIAIVPFYSTSINEADILGIQLHFEASMQNTDYFDLIEQSEAKRILEAQAYSLNAYTDDEHAIELGKLLSAEQIIIGNIGTVGEVFYLNIKLIDVETGKILVAKNLHADSLEELMFMIYPDIKYVEVDQPINETNEVNKVNIINFNSSDFGRKVDFKNIIIDGLNDDWEDIDPLELAKYDNNPYYESFYVAQDENFVYLRLDVIDSRSLFGSTKDLFFNISHSASSGDGSGDIQFGISFNGMTWSANFNQRIVDRGDDSVWEFGVFPRGYAFVKDVVEFKIDKNWLPNKDHLFIRAAFAENKPHKDLFWSDDFLFNL